jgi:cytochrome c oxidase assembly protein subunit 15
MYQPWLHRFAVVLSVATLFLIIAGAAVTSNEAGLSVPDWPLSYGKVMPEMKDGVFYEHGHRMVATTVGFLTTVLAVWLAVADKRSWMKKLGFAALAAVIVQGVLGGLTVLYQLPKPVSIAHACLAQLFFALTVVFTLVLSREWIEGTPEVVADHGFPSFRSMAVVVPVLILVQLALGAAFRHKAAGVIPHIVGAILVSAAILYEAISLLTQFPVHKILNKASFTMIGVIVVQLLLGLGAYITRSDAAESRQISPMLVLATVAHTAVGAVALASAIHTAVQVRRHVQQPQQQIASSSSSSSTGAGIRTSAA